MNVLNILFYVLALEDPHGFTFAQADQIITHFVNATSHTSLPDSLLNSFLGKYIMVYNTGTLDHAVNAIKYFEKNGTRKIRYYDYQKDHSTGFPGEIPSSSFSAIYY